MNDITEVSRSWSRKVIIEDSSNVFALAYSPATSELYVSYSSGGEYIFSRVHPDHFGEIVSADSVGATLNTISRRCHWPATETFEDGF